MSSFSPCPPGPAGAAARSLVAADLVTGRTALPRLAARQGNVCHPWPFAKTPKTPVLVPSRPHEYPLTRMYMRTHTHAPRETRDLPRTPSSRVERPHHATVLAQGKPRSLCGACWGLGAPLSPQCHGNPCWLPPRGAFPAGKSSELTAASCHVKAPQRASGALGPWRVGLGGGTLLPHSCSLSLFTVAFYV